jgi:hypothetical protein
MYHDAQNQDAYDLGAADGRQLEEYLALHNKQRAAYLAGIATGYHHGRNHGRVIDEAEMEEAYLAGLLSVSSLRPTWLQGSTR